MPCAYSRNVPCSPTSHYQLPLVDLDAFFIELLELWGAACGARSNRALIPAQTNAQTTNIFISTRYLFTRELKELWCLPASEASEHSRYDYIGILMNIIMTVTNGTFVNWVRKCGRGKTARCFLHKYNLLNYKSFTKTLQARPNHSLSLSKKSAPPSAQKR